MWCYRRYAGDKTMKTHKEFIEEIKESQKLENRTKDALNVEIKGCGNEFVLEGEDFICGDEIELDNTKSGCGYLLCQKCQIKHDALNVDGEVKG